MNRKLRTEERWILLSIPLLFIVGSLFHFLYDMSGHNSVVGLFSAVNESVWEHTKMVVLPPVLFWVIFYLCKGKQLSIDKNKWFTAAFAAVLTMIITIPTIFYFYTEAFGVEVLWVDILILLISNIIGQIIGLHIYRYSKGIKWYVAIKFICLIIILYGIFTFYPPHIPIFKDGPTGTYGI